MSVCGQNGQGEDDCAPEEMGASVRDLYKQKPASKVVRVLTVLAYLLSVSLAAILLSVYYVCVWKSPDLPHLNNTEPAALVQPLQNQTDNMTFANSTGRSGSTVMPANTQPTLTDPAHSDGEALQNTSPHVVNDLAPNTTSLPETHLQNIYNETSNNTGSISTTDSVT